MIAEPYKVLVTGAAGFVGSALMYSLKQRDHINPIGIVRHQLSDPLIPYSINSVGDMDNATDWTSVLSGIQVIIHTVGRAHVMNDSAEDPLDEYRSVNVGVTINLARQAAEAGVKRFIYISSIKVNGEQSAEGKPFTADDIPLPEDPYGISKFEAERGLQELAESTGMDIVIIRPPLVYGPGVKGNFASMVRLVGKGLPLPLGAVYNKRTLVALDNLVDLIVTCVDHPAAANQVFLAGDAEDLSTTELLRGVAKAMGKPCRLVPVPSFILRLGAILLGKKALAQRLLGSLRVDISKNSELLGWKPPLTVEEGLIRCFVSEKNQ